MGLIALGCAARRPPRAELGIPACPPSATQLLSPEALQCWFTARHGRWRLIDQVQHLEALVVTIGAEDLRDASEIARRLVAGESATFAEILVYASLEPVTERSPVRRVQWTRTGGYGSFDVPAIPAEYSRSR